MPYFDDRPYFERRAEEELDLAQRAAHPAAVKAHYDLLSHYLDQLYPRVEGDQAGPQHAPA
ncbi:hypothetical protein [Sphingomonas sp.]|uniref:hypothetical protein n=1 Tax=Sphingomonas sp. TaxID=28214 RepID=UPI003B3B1A52